MAIYIKVLKLKMHDYTNVCTKEGEIINSRLIERDLYVIEIYLYIILMFLRPNNYNNSILQWALLSLLLKYSIFIMFVVLELKKILIIDKCVLFSVYIIIIQRK